MFKKKVSICTIGPASLPAEFLEHTTSSPYHSRWKRDHQYMGERVNAILSKDGRKLEDFNSGGKFLDK